MIKDNDMPKYFKESLDIYKKDKDYDAFVRRNYAYKTDSQIRNCKCKQYPMRPDFIDNEKKTREQQRACEMYLDAIDKIYQDNYAHYWHLENMMKYLSNTSYADDIYNQMKTHKIKHPFNNYME